MKEQDSKELEEPKNNLKHLIFTVLFVSLLFLLVGFVSSFLSRTKIVRKTPPVSKNSVIVENNKEAKKEIGKKPEIEVKENIVHSSTSPNSAYNLEIYQSGDECSYSVWHVVTEKKITLTEAEDIYKPPVSCSVIPYAGPAGYLSNRVDWFNDSSFFLNNKRDALLQLININNKSRDIKSIFYKNWGDFQGIDKTKSLLLWRNIGSGSAFIFSVTDINREVIKILYNDPPETLIGIESVYAPRNNGVVFIKHHNSRDLDSVDLEKLLDPKNACQCKPDRDKNCLLIWTEVDFISFDDLVLKNLITTSKKLYNTCGRGCYGPQIIKSEKDRIIMKLDCIWVDEKHTNEEGYTVLDL